ncbi:MAG: LamG domain-containing protein [Planctomycetes bacterium]|nr:LamG domain-containing protein [Planctomycetota bacterium]MBL7145481.1 LamG domain-containing protein [Phycisphaerae bacterium]
MFRKTKLFVAMLLVLGICTDAVLAELIGYWPFDEGKGTEAADITGNGNDGTINGAVEWVPGYKDSALRFDTAGERVVVGPIDPTAENNAMTLAAWINWEGEGHTIGQQGIIGKRLGWDPGTGVKWFWQTNPAGDFLFRADSANGGGGGGLGWGNALIAPYANEWIHVAVTWNNGAVVQYINGEQVSTGNINFIDTADDTPVTIGCVDSTNTETFVGTIDEARIYDKALTPPEIQTIMLGIFPTAFRPNPADGTIHEDTWVSLSWEPGTSAASHDVYFGDNFDDVDGGAESTFQGNQPSEFLVVGFPGFAFPDGLVPGTTYYWRIVEVEADGTTKHKGAVWSFTVPPRTAYFPDPADGAESVLVNGRLKWTAGYGSKLHTVYFGDNFNDVNSAAGGLPQGTTTYNPGILKMAATYYWRVDEFDIVETHKGDVWSFITEGAVANPDPANGAVDVSQTAVLGWTPGVFGTSHEVYFGTDAASLELKGSGNLGSESYDPGQLEWNTTYYWRVDEANNANADSPWTGPLWSFATANFLIVDDMESYNDIDEGQAGSNRIYLAWVDGFDNPAINGSVVGNTNPPFAEQTIVHGGSQSMPFAYDNAVGKSEVTLTLTSNRDWTFKGLNTLTIWFRGNTANAAENLYVALNGSAVVNNDNPDAAQAIAWTQWNIDLQAFADQGVNLASVNTITIGLGDRSNPAAGGAGMMYFDDIRLYAR